MDYLARREHGRGELVDKLVRFGFGNDIADIAVTQLIDDGLQSDERFAEAFVRSRINQGKGPARIRQELTERNLNASLIEETIQAADADWFGLARDVRSKKFGDGLPQEFSEKARQMRFLQQRGFETAHIQAAVSSHGDD